MLGNRFTKIYLPALWMAMSAIALASGPEEDEKKEPEMDPALAALHAIVDTAFPLEPYEPLKDKDPGDQEPSLRIDAATQRIPALFEVPLEILRRYLFPCFDSRTLLLGARQTCQYFNQLSRLSSFRLNGYCLAETRVHNIPVGRLCAKTCSTQDGILRLASLMGVCATDLARWFEPDFLQAAFQRYKNILPPQLEGQSEEVLERLYPVIKIALAAVDEAHPLDPAIMPLLQEYPHPYELSLNKMRLLSLNPARPGVYYETLEQLTRRYSAPASPERVVITRELLRMGKNVATLNNTFLVLYGNAQQRTAATQIISWCIQNPQFRRDQDRFPLIDNALSLGRPDLASEVLREVIALPDNADTMPHKIQAFSHDKVRDIEDWDIQFSIQQFSENLYAYWGQLHAYTKFQALSLLMQAERRAEVQEAIGNLLQLMDDPVQCDGVISGAFYTSVSVFNDLHRYHYREELEQLTRRLLNVKTEKLLSIIHLYNGTFTQLIKIDRERTIAFLKAFIESDRVWISCKLSALACLAEHAQEEKNYIASQLDSLNYDGNEGADAEGNLMWIYYHLNNQELCSFYYQKLIQKELDHEDPDSILNQDGLKKLRDAGFPVERVEDLLGYDPFAVLSIFSAEKD